LTRAKPRLALTFSPAALAPADLPRLVELARVADDAGIDAIRVPEHVALGRDTSAYRWGVFPYPPSAPWLEPLTAIAAMAAVTRRVDFLTGILIAPLRSAVILAKQVATVDALSGGRIALGVGAGWQPSELEAGGVPFAERAPRMFEVIEACRTLWEDAPARFAGRWTSFEEVWCEPRPPRRVPVWFASGLGRDSLGRMVELGDGWLPIMGSTPEQIAAGAARIADALAQAGRSPDAFEIAGFAVPTGDSLERTLVSARGLASSGVTMVSLYWPAFEPELSRVPAFIERVASVWAGL
jgi:probable F420-dependent oxidoreductase